MKVSKGDIFERVFVNEPEVDLHIEQEAGSKVKIVVVNFETSRHRDSEISNKIFIEQVGEGCETEIYALAYLKGDEYAVKQMLAYKKEATEALSVFRDCPEKKSLLDLLDYAINRVQ